MVINTKLGGRRVELFLPFEHNGLTIDAVEFGPFLYDYTMRWRAGKFPSAVAMLIEVSSLQSEDLLRQLRYPDAERVLDVFMSWLPEEIRSDIANASIPVAARMDGDQATEFDAGASEDAPEAPGEQQDEPMGMGVGLDLDGSRSQQG